MASLKFDHVVIHADALEDVIEFKAQLDHRSIPFEPSWGKKAKGFEISNLWCGLQYFEIVQITGGDCRWQPEWVTRDKQGDRGAYCVFFVVPDIELAYQALFQANLEPSQPERTEIKWFFNLLTRKLPWRFILLPPLPGTKIEIGFIQYDDAVQSRLRKYFEPNTDKIGINGLEIKRIASSNVVSAQKRFTQIVNALGGSSDIEITRSSSNRPELLLSALLSDKTKIEPFAFLNVAVES